MLKSFKYRIYPTVEQATMIDKTIGVCRLIYNLALEVKTTAWKEKAVNISAYDLQKEVKELRKEYDWIADVNSQAICEMLGQVDNSFKRFFKGSGYPRFKKRKNGGSFRCHNNKREINWENKTLTIPKIKDIPIVLSRQFEGKIKTVTISRTPTGKYFASILVETAAIKVIPKGIIEGSTIGIDTGIKDFVVTSGGRKFEANRRLKNSLKRLQFLQRRASRKKKGSNNRKKANKCVATLHEKITNQRTDYIHKVTTQLTHDNQVGSIVIEDLNVAGMLKNHKLAQAISDISLGEFYRQLTYKCEWYGINLIKIGRFDPSSKRCSDCGEINHDLTLADRKWTCKCGSVHDRDFNAAKNIKWFGLNNSRRDTPGEPVESLALAGAMKQEITNVKIDMRKIRKPKPTQP